MSHRFVSQEEAERLQRAGQVVPFITREQHEATNRGGIVRTRTGKAYKAASIRNYERTLRLHVLPVLGARKVADVRRADVQDLVDGLVAQDLAPVTVQCAILPLRAIYGRARRPRRPRGEPDEQGPRAGVRRARDSIRIPSLDDAVQLLEALELRDRALYGTALYAGLRRGELQALKWPRVDLATGVIHVEAGWDRIDREEIEPKTEDGRRKVPVRAESADRGRKDGTDVSNATHDEVKRPTADSPEHGAVSLCSVEISKVLHWVEDDEHLLQSTEFEVYAAHEELSEAVTQFLDNAEDRATSLNDLDPDDITLAEYEQAIAILKRFSEAHRQMELKSKRRVLVQLNLSRGSRRRRGGFRRSAPPISSPRQLV